MDAVNSKFGYYIEVDLEIPNNLHDKLDQLPLAPELKPPPNSKIPKLLLTHWTKQNYKIHFRLLQYFMQMGVKVTKIHRAVKFTQAPVFKKYVTYNTNKRIKSKSTFKKNFYKLKNNSLYGKTVEGVRKRKNMRLCNTARRLKCYTSKATFKRSLLIDDNLVAVLMKKEKIILDRPVFIGQAVLDLSKLRMYELNYSDFEKYRAKFNCALEIVAGDTDSFFVECHNVSLRNQLLPAMLEDDILDTSNYAITDPLYTDKYANKIGLIKDESACKIVYKEWIFIRPKCYSLLTYDGENIKKAKGIIRDTVKRKLSHDDYNNIFTHPDESHYEKQRKIVTSNHQLITLETCKRVMGGVNAGDDKRLWYSKNESRAYGHFMDK
jgi:hypothetical protein